MTLVAVVVSKRRQRLAADVALFAIDADMTPDEGKFRHVVVEFPRLDLFETSGLMALLAIAAESAVMDVPVARSAILEAQTAVIDVLVRILFLGDLFRVRRRRRPRNMTLDAFQVAMLAGQPVSGAVVIEADCRTPALIIVALEAIAAQLVPMLIDMAIQTYCSQPKVGPAKINILVAFQFGSMQETRMMALAALQSTMSPIQSITCQRMIEVVAPILPEDQLEIASVVLGVALETMH